MEIRQNPGQMNLVSFKVLTCVTTLVLVCQFVAGYDPSYHPHHQFLQDNHDLDRYGSYHDEGHHHGDNHHHRGRHHHHHRNRHYHDGDHGYRHHHRHRHDQDDNHYGYHHNRNDNYDPRSDSDFYDLTYTFNNESIFYPGQQFDFNLLRDVGPTRNFTTVGNYEYSYASWSFCVSEHGGTHIDAPFHFNRFGWKTHEIPLKRLVDVPGVVIDVEHDTFALPHPDKFTLEVEHIREHEHKYGKIPPGAVVLVRFGWAQFYPDKLKYTGWRNSTPGEMPTLHFPGLSGNAASWLLRERQIIGVGTDTMSTDIGDERGNPVVHIILLESQVYLLENVANLDFFVKNTRSHHRNKCPNLRLFIMPMKTEGTGGPTRIVAYCKHL